MSDPVLNALRRNREIAAKAGQLERVERIDARLAELDRPQPKRSKSKKKEKEPEPAKVPEPEPDYGVAALPEPKVE